MIQNLISRKLSEKQYHMSEETTAGLEPEQEQLRADTRSLLEVRCMNAARDLKQRGYLKQIDGDHVETWRIIYSHLNDIDTELAALRSQLAQRQPVAGVDERLKPLIE